MLVAGAGCCHGAAACIGTVEGSSASCSITLPPASLQPALPPPLHSFERTQHPSPPWLSFLPSLGQVLVYHDLLGMMQHPHHAKVTPKFCKQYSVVGRVIQEVRGACPEPFVSFWTRLLVYGEHGAEGLLLRCWSTLGRR